MFDVGKSKFYRKSKQLLKLLKTRIDTIRKKRNAVHKYLRSDVAELLKSGLDVNAYGRAEGLLVELNISSCYDFVEQCIMCISAQLSSMENQRECPVECREAIPSLMHAAARFADLPELRDLRKLFTERYGTSLEPFINKEFVEKLRARPPTKEKKLQLMQEIAQENSKQWDPMSLEQKMFKPSPPAHDKPKHGSFHGSEDNGSNRQKRRDNALPGRDGQNGGNKATVVRKYDVPKRNEIDFTYHGRNVVPHDRYNAPISSDDEVAASTSRDSQQTSSSSIGSFSDDEVDSNKPSYYGSIPPPYVKRNAEDHTEDQAQQTSARKSTLKPPPGREIFDNGSEEGAKKAEKARQRLHSILKDYEEDQSDEEEKKLDELLMRYSKKKPPGQESDDTSRAKRDRNARMNLYPPGQEKDDANGAARSWHRSGRANAYPPGQQYDETSGGRRRGRSEIPNPPARAKSSPLEQADIHEAMRGHARTVSLQPDMMNCPGHVHPKLPDYDDLAARLAALRKQ
ncbi:IST1-like protein [Melia azedarach]|uniref:IST1-like protein n=1 Tax=Melia azedarach TaxID=155640 RepID=A0ACC1Y350_MELAZ|nr:IST1-like protein [Melia azedarach]